MTRCCWSTWLLYLSLFFFQAEDGIRDLVRSRGLGDVYKRQVPVVPVDNKISLEILLDRASIEIFANGGQTVVSNCFTPTEAVSYTHLTLPTSDLV